MDFTGETVFGRRMGGVWGALRGLWSADVQTGRGEGASKRGGGSEGKVFPKLGK